MIERYEVATFSGVPTIFSMLLMGHEPSGFDLSSVRFALCGAAPMPVELFHRFQQQTGIRILEGYGLTEATVCSSLTPVDAEPRIGSIGVRIPYTLMKTAVLDEQGRHVRDCDVDEVGVIVVKGPTVTPGYTDPTRNEGLFAAVDPDGRWLNTGDLARQDRDGYF